MNLARQAIIVLQERGWTQHTQQAADGSVCLAGALCVAINAVPNAPPYASVETVGPLLNACDKVAYEQWPERTVDDPYRPRDHLSVRFNNHPDTTLLDVVTLLEKVAVGLDEAA